MKLGDTESKEYPRFPLVLSLMEYPDNTPIKLILVPLESCHGP